MMTDHFDKIIDGLPKNGGFVSGLIFVADTMRLMKTWFDDHEIKYTAADLIEAAKLVHVSNKDAAGKLRDR
jgi:hypothetical protein